MHFTRRAGIVLAAGAVAVSAAIAPAVADEAGVSVLVATNEPYGTYHIRAMVEYVEEQDGRVALVVPDHEQPSTDGVEIVTLEEAEGWGADLLVINGATEWPFTVVEHLDDLDVVASSLAYLNPVEAELAPTVRPRLIGATAQSASEAAVFAAHFGIDAGDITVVGNAGLDDLAPYTPEDRTVLIATSVTHPSETGGAAPGTELLLDTASELQAAGYHIRVGLHPRENPELWADYEIATEGTLLASATAEVVVGIPGSVFPQVAAVGAPLVGILDPALSVPDYILALAAEARTVDEAVAAVDAAWTPNPEELGAIVGPVGGSKARLWDYWAQAARPATAPTPSPAPSSTPTASTTPSASPTAGPTQPERPGLPGTGVAAAPIAAWLPIVAPAA